MKDRNLNKPEPDKTSYPLPPLPPICKWTSYATGVNGLIERWEALNLPWKTASLLNSASTWAVDDQAIS